ncbi:MAG: cell wall metabolism sensor histidine kinase WalK [Verrucomicrobiae bacterium]|nr:cell wall metabolism sensor histidine kinase WalK [Verrucomicrobiae bacterium]
MSKLSLQWKTFLALTGLLTLLLLLATAGTIFSLSPLLVRQVQADLERDCRLVHHLAAPLLATQPLPTNEINRLAHDLARLTGLRITVIARDGTVVGESDRPAHELLHIENHLLRPEVQDALHRGIGIARRYSDTVQAQLLYVALPALPAGATAPQGVVRVAIPLRTVAQTTRRVGWIVLTASIFVTAISAPVLFWLTRRYGRPLEAMCQMARRVAQGDFTARAPHRLAGELGALGQALNDMACQLAAHLRELNEEKAGLAAILSSMADGVMVTDAAGKIRLINRALCEQFQLTGEAVGKTPLEVLRNVELEQLIADHGTRELTFFTPTDRTYLVNATPLEHNAGTVVVFHDITRLKQLENIRKDFVANVSHELRTPLSIIKGCTETLLDEQPPDEATTKRFLQTIQRHCTRLEQLVEELLTIAALESHRAQLELVAVSIRELAAAVVEELAIQAKEKNITVELALPDSMPQVRADRERLRQVFTNLLDNAIKYTHAGGHVTISATHSATEVECCVADNGPGIAPEHLPRIFERFYRVDKARSRELGGTGLGLSIVKHIVQAHGGRGWAQGELERGSRFYFTLPLA